MMDSPPKTSLPYDHLRFMNGDVDDVSLSLVDETINIFTNNTLLIMGPTGAGKSSFIEALAGESQSLGISKNQLAGYTQEVNAYQLQNVRKCDGPSDDSPLPICLIDTPGFSDSKISEMEIINKVKAWMQVKEITSIGHILYLHPMADTRLPGSKRRTIKMIQSLLYESTEITVVTTMWDQLCNDQAKERAESHFKQLSEEIWKDVISRGGLISKFHNTRSSALEILNSAVIFRPYGGFPFLPHDSERLVMVSPLLYQQLLDRIENIGREKQALGLDLLHIHANDDAEVEAVLRARLDEVEHDLLKFLSELVLFGIPPKGYENAPEAVIYHDLLDRVNEARQDTEMFSLDLQRAKEETAGGNKAARIAKVSTQLKEAKRRLGRYSKQAEKHKGLNPPSASATRKILNLTMPHLVIPLDSPYATTLKDTVDKGLNSVKKMRVSWHFKIETS